MMINGDKCHDILLDVIKPRLSFDTFNTFQGDFSAWKQEIKDKFLSLTGLSEIEKNACALNFHVEKEDQKDGYTQIRFVFESEVGAEVPCYLLIPNTGKEKYPVAILLQGHSSGFHNSIGEPKCDAEKDYAFGRGQFAVQAVRNGFAALAIEQRGMGERKPTRENRRMGNMCEFTAHRALLLGRTILGERIWDVSRAIDCLSAFKNLDINKIIISGNSGGGTASYYAACYDERIKLCVPSCSFCSYKTSILDVYHCSCNFIPSAYQWFEMQDLSCLIAPRNLLVIAGKEDVIFPIDGVKTAYGTIEKIFQKAGCEKNCRLVVTEKGHWWCEDVVWREILKELQDIAW